MGFEETEGGLRKVVHSKCGNERERGESVTRGQTQVSGMIARSSAADSGLVNVGDILLSVDGHGVAGFSIEDTVSLIRSKPGTSSTPFLVQPAIPRFKDPSGKGPRTPFCSCKKEVFVPEDSNPLTRPDQLTPPSHLDQGADRIDGIHNLQARSRVPQAGRSTSSLRSYRRFAK